MTPDLERYEFDVAEIDGMGRELARTVAHIAALKDARSDAAKGFSDDIKEAEETALRLAECIRNGFEMRPVERQPALPFEAEPGERPRRERKG